MDPLWVISSVGTLVGLTALTIALRQVGTAAEDLRRQFDQIGELQVAVSRLKAEAAATRPGRTTR